MFNKSNLITAFLLCTIIVSGVSFAATADLADYRELRRQVRETLARGEERTQDAVEREKVRTYWEIGKLIHEHILLNKERADYGQKVLKRLSGDLQISERELYYMVEFARTYPILRTSAKLSWNHYEALLRINDAPKRQELAVLAAKENWTIRKTRHEIKKLKAANQITVSETPADEPLVPIKGKLNVFRVVIAEAGEWKGKPVIDLGFSNYYHPGGNFYFKEGDIIRVSENQKLSRLKDATEVDLFTYKAYPLEITDGDTLWVLIDLGFGFTTKQSLRLRGIDAAEITSRDGFEAKRFVERELKNVSSVTITSTKSDKYDRYLADLFYNMAAAFLKSPVMAFEIPHFWR